MGWQIAIVLLAVMVMFFRVAETCSQNGRATLQIHSDEKTTMEKPVHQSSMELVLSNHSVWDGIRGIVETIPALTTICI